MIYNGINYKLNARNVSNRCVKLILTKINKNLVSVANNWMICITKLTSKSFSAPWQLRPFLDCTKHILKRVETHFKICSGSTQYYNKMGTKKTSTHSVWKIDVRFIQWRNAFVYVWLRLCNFIWIKFDMLLFSICCFLLESQWWKNVYVWQIGRVIKFWENVLPITQKCTYVFIY